MNEWKVARVLTRPESKRDFIWEVSCPDEYPELSWENDFGRGMRCRCRRFRTEGKATRYVEAQKALDASGAGE